MCLPPPCALDCVTFLKTFSAWHCWLNTYTFEACLPLCLLPPQSPHSHPHWTSSQVSKHQFFSLLHVLWISSEQPFLTHPTSTHTHTHTHTPLCLIYSPANPSHPRSLSSLILPSTAHPWLPSHFADSFRSFSPCIQQGKTVENSLSQFFFNLCICYHLINVYEWIKVIN